MTELFVMLVETIDKYGSVTAVIASLLLINVFFIWRDFRREDRQQKQVDSLYEHIFKRETQQQEQIDALYHHIQESVFPLLVECREAIATSKEVIKQNSEIIGNMKNG